MNEEPFIRIIRADESVVHSPVRYLWRRVGAALRIFSRPVRDRQIASGMNIALELIQQRRFQLDVTSTGELKISTGALSLLWACSHLNLTYWEARNKAGPLGAKVDIDPEKDHDLKMAYLLLEWAVNHALCAEGEEEWPAELPQPAEMDSPSGDESAADQITFRALGFILAHEFAHVTLRHNAYRLAEIEDPERKKAAAAISIDQEKDADREAVENCFEGCSDSESGEFICRGYGIVTALYFASITGFFDGAWGGSSHPPGWLRMEHALAQLSLRDYHPTMVFAAELKSLYVSFSGAPTGGKFETAADSMEHLYEICSSGQLQVETKDPES